MARYDENGYRTCLKDQFFLSAIKLASSSLYREVEKSQFDFDALDARAQISIKKYFNRVCHRPTPFGLFSSFSPLTWEAESTKITLVEKGQLTLNTDFTYAVKLIREQPVSVDQVAFYSNKTMYQVGCSWRYLLRNPDEKFGKEHGIQSLAKDPFLKNLLEFCNTGKKGYEIKTYLLDYFEDELAAQGYLTQLIDAQLLISELLPNIVGETYITRIKNKSDSVFAGEFPADLQLSRKVEGSNAHPGPLGNEKYGIYERTASGSTLDSKYQEFLLEGLDCLNRLAPVEQPSLLKAFIDKFISRFENQEIPLLVALDPEVGIGYGQMEQLMLDDNLCSGIDIAREQREASVSWGGVQEMLVSKWTAEFNRCPTDPITITEGDLTSLPDSPSCTPPGLNIVFRVLQSDRVFIEQAGGVTATALQGRFTPFNERILSEVRQMARAEMESNSQAIFAEIGYFNNEHAANINVREHLFEYEIPVLTHSTLPFESQLALNDLFVSVKDGKIILRSKRLDKIVIPRLSSAYNYNRSELSVFRFLCDIQYQGVKSNFGLDMKRLFPNLPFYPRVEYKNCILSPATWVFDKADLEEPLKNREDFRRFLASRNLPQFIAINSNDHQLVFNLKIEDELEFLIQCVRKNTKLELVELFQPSDIVIESGGSVLMNQFIATLYNSYEVYAEKKQEVIQLEKKPKMKRAFFPGEGWVYLKIYCHEAASDEILCKYIEPFVTKLRRDGIIDQWFFIRYKDPESHLRIRVRRVQHFNNVDILTCFTRKLYPLVRRGSVVSILTDTYKREIERYGSDVIEEVEAFFGASSDVVINSLKRATINSEGRLIEAFQAADLILTSLTEFPDHKTQILKTIYENMNNEFEGGKELKVKLDLKFREYRSLVRTSLNEQGLIKGGAELNKTLAVIKSKSHHWPLSMRFELIGDLLHMHINRIFKSDQRKHEFIIYYLLYKHYESTTRRATYASSGSCLQLSVS